MRENVALRGRPVVGFGEQLASAPVAEAASWGIALASSMVGAVTGWALDGVTNSIRGRLR